jgi:hypothetical protein
MELVDSRKESIRGKLSQELAKIELREGEESLTGFVVRIAKPADVPTVSARLREVSEKALRKGMAVKVDVEVE